MYDAKDKVILVTGGATGIGAGVARAFLEEGAKHVAALDVDIKSGEALEMKLNNKFGGNKCKFYKCDVTSSQLFEAYEDVLKNFSYIDVVVNNAGLMNDGIHAFEKMISVNVIALISSSMKAYSLMRKDRDGKGGTIVNISSIIALGPGRLYPIYGATKSAVLQFSQSLGLDPHYNRSGVRVITLCFGCTSSTALFTQFNAIDEETNEYAKKMLQLLPWQKPESAVRGLVEAYKRGASASVWLASADRPAEEITKNVRQAYEILGQGVLTRNDADIDNSDNSSSMGL